MSRLTHRGLQALKAGEWRSDGGARGAGALAARREGENVLFYFRYMDSSGARAALPLGAWSGSGGPLSLEAARQRAHELSRRYLAGERDLREALAAEERERRRQREAEERAREAEATRKAATLAALLDAYVLQLRREGKPSASAVAAAFARHVTKPWPKLAATPAEDVTLHDLLAVVARLTNAGKRNEARKLRASLRAAYAAANRALQDAQPIQELRALRVSTNPARDLAAIRNASQAHERALSLRELCAYWRRISAIPGPDGAALRFHLLTGGQRVEQLGRVTLADYDRDLQAITLRDGKGRRSTPRAHVVPLIPAAVEAMEAMAPERVGDYAATVTHGLSGISMTTLRNRLRPVVGAMREAGELEGGEFTVGDLRRTVETRLAAAGVSQEVRAQLQSHGLGGIQQRHYDRHDYLEEKREALETLHRLAVGEEGNVVSFGKRGGRRRA